MVKKSANPAAQANFRAEVFREYRVNAHASGPGGGGGAHHTQGPGGTRGGSSAAGSFCIALGLLIDVLNVFAALDGEAELSLRWPDHDGRLAGNITGLLRHSREVLDWLLRVLVVHEPCRLSSVECVLTHDNNVVRSPSPTLTLKLPSAPEEDVACTCADFPLPLPCARNPICVVCVETPLCSGAS